MPRTGNIIDFALKNRVLLLAHKPGGIKIDISLGILPFEINSVKKRTTQKTNPGIFYLPCPEDLIIFKAIARRPQDIEDIKGILDSHPGINKKKVLKTVKDFSDALEKPEIYEDITQLLAGI